jgi:hypothetical protein
MHEKRYLEHLKKLQKTKLDKIPICKDQVGKTASSTNVKLDICMQKSDTDPCLLPCTQVSAHSGLSTLI